jgi:ankyrin repeat protein
LRSVYYKFEKENYSTGHDRHPESNCAGSPADVEAGGPTTYPQPFTVAVSERVVPRAPICVPTGHTQMAALNVSSMQTSSTLSHGFVHDCRYGSSTPSQIQSETGGQRLTAPGSLVTGLPLESSKKCRNRESKQQKLPCVPEQDFIERNLRDASVVLRHSGGRTRHRIRPKEDTGGTTESHRLKKLTSFTSFLPKKNNVSKPWANQVSPLANRDSGHYSSHGTISSRGVPSTQYLRDSGYYSTGSRGAPSTLYSIDSMTSQGEPLTEIRGPYRVDCHTPHEPKFPSEYRRMKPCNACRYSNIHNLAWISSCLTLNKFEGELRIERLYDFEALDAAENSALHYAAASGASYAHLKALILAGVPPHQQNTSKQNFLHCLPPYDIGADDWDPNYFNVNLIGLLELLEPKDIFGQQDNDGQTVLHVLTLHITNPEVRKQIIGKFTQSGFPPIVLDRFGGYATSNDPPWWTETIDFPSDPAHDTVSTSSPDLEVLGTEWEDNPYDPIIQAYGNPHSFDRKTKDTILHALSRVNVEACGSIQSSDMIKYLHDFVTKGVNRNWHNAEGQTPLTAFIYNKDLRGSETGATMAKYIDVILWKDCEPFRNNEINVDMMNRRGATALYEAAIRGQAHSVRSLIEAGANVNARLSMPDTIGTYHLLHVH